jgi:hypothetical protein
MKSAVLKRFRADGAHAGEPGTTLDQRELELPGNGASGAQAIACNDAVRATAYSLAAITRQVYPCRNVY